MLILWHADYAANDSSKDFCNYCCGEKGNLLPYDSVFINMASFFSETKWIDIEEAKKTVKGYLKQMLVWKDKDE